MEAMTYAAAAVAIFAAATALTRVNAVHALLFLIAALLALAGVFVLMGASFAGLLQVIVYAGAIMVLFVFVVMMLNLGAAAEDRERRWLTQRMWPGSFLLCAILFLELAAVVASVSVSSNGSVDARAVGVALFGPYLLAVEVASLLLLAGLVAAWHVGRGERGGGR